MTIFKKNKNYFFASVLAYFALSACVKKAEQTSVASGAKSLYVATGSCNSGVGITTYTTTATRTLEMYSTLDGSHAARLLDYNAPGMFVAATHPRSLVDNGSSLYILNENGTTTSERKVILVPKTSPTTFSSFYTNPTVLNGAVMSLFKDVDGSLLISKSTAVEKINGTPIRLPAGANPWVSAPGGSCATATTAISAVISLPPILNSIAGKVVFLHQGATAVLNRIGITSGTGYFTTSDCLSAAQISAVTHTKASNLTPGTVTFNANGTSPTAMVFIQHVQGTITGKLLVAYSNGQTSNNNAGVYNLNHGLVMWDVNEPSETTATLSNPIVVYDNSTVLFGVSAMSYDPISGLLYVATAGETGAANQTTNGYGYNVERFSVSFDGAEMPVVNRLATGGQPFIKGGATTKCISGMALGD